MTQASEGLAARPGVRPLMAWSVLAVASVGVLLSGAELSDNEVAMLSRRFTSLRDLAQTSNQTLIGFLRGHSLNVYSGRQRLRP